MRKAQTELIERYNEVRLSGTFNDKKATTCYTDASLRYGLAGYGFFLASSDARNRKGKLKGRYDETSTSVELGAITESLNHIRSMRTGSYLLRSDSLGAVNAIYRELGDYAAGSEYYDTRQVHHAASVLTDMLEIGYYIMIEWVSREHPHLRRANQLARYVVGCKECVEEGPLHDLYALTI